MAVLGTSVSPGIRGAAPQSASPLQVKRFHQTGLSQDEAGSARSSTPSTAGAASSGGGHCAGAPEHSPGFGHRLGHRVFDGPADSFAAFDAAVRADESFDRDQYGPAPPAGAP